MKKKEDEKHRQWARERFFLLVAILTASFFLVLVVVVVLWVIWVYNGFIRAVNRTKEAWADIDVQLKRRYDLIPNLVETVKGYAKHERGAFKEVTEARSRALGAQSVSEKGQAENQLAAALKSIFAIAENYPQLRAVESFVNLQNELADTENKIQAARRFYNGNVRDLNTKIQSFPYSLIARAFNLKERELFELESGKERQPVTVKMS